MRKAPQLYSAGGEQQPLKKRKINPSPMTEAAAATAHAQPSPAGPLLELEGEYFICDTTAQANACYKSMGFYVVEWDTAAASLRLCSASDDSELTCALAAAEKGSEAHTVIDNFYSAVKEFVVPVVLDRL